jgi:dipeptidyl aminopeptidase/acylaminoacyl peptidase
VIITCAQERELRVGEEVWCLVSYFSPRRLRRYLPSTPGWVRSRAPDRRCRPRGDTILFGLGGFFQRAEIKSAQVMSIRTDGAGLTALTQGDVNNGMPSWSPDGKQVVYRVAQGTTRQLYILDVATKKSLKLETGSNYDTFPTWSPRGDWIAFTSNRDGDSDLSHQARRHRASAADSLAGERCRPGLFSGRRLDRLLDSTTGFQR